MGGHGKDYLASWDVETGQILAQYTYEYGIYDATFSGDGRYVLGAGGSQVVAWDAATGGLLYWENNFYSLGAWVVAASPDGTMFATAGTVAENFDEIPVWDTATGVIRHTFKVTLPGQYPNTTVLRFSPDNKYLVAAFEDGWIKAWNLETGTLAFTIQVQDEWIGDLSFSQDSSHLLVGASHIYIYRMPYGGLVRSYGGLPLASYGPWYGIDGKLKSLTLSNGVVTIIDVESGAELARLEGHLRPNSSGALTPDGATLILGKSGGTLEVRDIASRAVRMNLQGDYTPDDLAVSPDGTMVAGIFRYSWDDIITKVIAWDLTTGQKLYTIPDNDITMGDIQFSPDSAALLIGYNNDTISRVDARTGQTLETYADFVEGEARVILMTDGRTVALMSRDLLTFWDLVSASPVREFPISTADISHFFPSTTVFSADGALLAIGDSQDYDSAVVDLWNVQTGQFIARIDDGLDHGAFAGVFTIAFSRDNSLMSVGIYDGTILLVDTRSGQLARVLQGHGDIVSWMQFLPQTGQLTSASNDGTVVFWQVP